MEISLVNVRRQPASAHVTISTPALNAVPQHSVDVSADWEPPVTDPKQAFQTISSYEGYIAAMRKKGANGDEICLAASADLLGLRHIVFDTRGYISEGVVQERLIDLRLDLVPENLHFELRANRTERRLSSRSF